MRVNSVVFGCVFSFYNKDESDFQDVQDIQVQNIVQSNGTEVRLLTTNDEVTLEYDDSVILSFTPANDSLITRLDGVGEYIRHTLTVHIIDNDGEHIVLNLTAYFPLKLIISESKKVFLQYSFYIEVYIKNVAFCHNCL